MEKIKAIIIDDERLARKELAFLLKDFPEVKIIGEADNITVAVNLVEELKPDLVFLDIQLTGETGFELLEKVCINFKVIFVTAFDEFAIKAFDVNASDYLLKPVDPKRLKLALSRIFEEPYNNESSQKKFSYNDSIFLKQNNCTARFVEINTICAITSVGNHSKIITQDGNRYIILKTLKQWEAELPEEYFIRVHRSTIVNLKSILKIDTSPKNRNQVFLKNTEEPFEVSRNCYKGLKAAYQG